MHREFEEVAALRSHVRTLVTARVVAPMLTGHEGETIDGGGVLVEDAKVLAVGNASDLRDGAEAVDDWGDVLLVPGLVNAHVHLELSNARPGPKPESFGEWLLGVVRSRPKTAGDLHGAMADAARAGAAESLGFGVTTVGDITRYPAATRPALAGAGLRVVSFGEVQALGQLRGEQADRLATATSPADGVTVAVSPHAPYTVEPDAYRACLGWAEANGRPIATHLAETTEEADFLNDHAGPLRELWDELGKWDDRVPRFAGSPAAFAKSVGLLDARVPVVLAHCNHLSDADLDLLARSNASVVYCPRTHAYFGHPPHPMEALLSRGVNVCLGTDSRASSPDLNLLADAARVRRERPHLAAGLIWSMLTTRPAAALGLAGTVGTLAPGAAADLVAFPLTDPRDPLGSALDARPLPSRAHSAR